MRKDGGGAHPGNGKEQNEKHHFHQHFKNLIENENFYKNGVEVKMNGPKWEN